MWEFIWSLVGLIIGALITWLCSRYYYKRAGDELRVEADRIRKLSNLIGHALEQRGPVEFKRDDNGEITSIYVKLACTGGGKSGGTATLTVDKKAKDSETPSEN